ncbi:MAG: hypothetical protein OXC44_04375 [Proteobacteria bacterium]|nr:hypothetical protein [Pseudomonadota bacterium]
MKIFSKAAHNKTTILTSTALLFVLGGYLHYSQAALPRTDIKVHITIDGIDFGAFDKVLLDNQDISNGFNKAANHFYVHSSSSSLPFSNPLEKLGKITSYSPYDPSNYNSDYNANYNTNYKKTTKPSANQLMSGSSTAAHFTFKLQRSFVTDRSLYAWMQKQAHHHPHPKNITLTWKEVHTSYTPYNLTASTNQASTNQENKSIHLLSSRPLYWSLEAQKSSQGGYTEHIIIAAKRVSIHQGHKR